jgi:hypothetical protein
VVCRVDRVKRRRPPYVLCDEDEASTKRSWQPPGPKPTEPAFPSSPLLSSEGRRSRRPQSVGVRAAFDIPQGMLLLFESPAGFALFKVLDEGKLKQADVRAQLPDPRPCSPSGKPLDPHRPCEGWRCLPCLRPLGIPSAALATARSRCTHARRRHHCRPPPPFGQSAAAAGGGWEGRGGWYCTDGMPITRPGLCTAHRRRVTLAAWRGASPPLGRFDHSPRRGACGRTWDTAPQDWRDSAYQLVRRASHRLPGVWKLCRG